MSWYEFRPNVYRAREGRPLTIFVEANDMIDALKRYRKVPSSPGKHLIGGRYPTAKLLTADEEIALKRRIEGDRKVVNKNISYYIPEKL